MSFQITLNMMFSAFDKLNDFKKDGEKILEISVYQNQVTFTFESGNIVYLDILSDIEKIIDPIKITDITFFEDRLRASCRDLSELEPQNGVVVKNPLCLFKYVVTQISELVCKCPALEFVVSETFIKCYIDKKNIPLNNLIKLDELFDSEGVLELGLQRSYVLYPRVG